MNRKLRRNGQNIFVLGILDVAAQVEFESKTLKHFIMFRFQALRFRRLQRGFDRVSLRRPTLIRLNSSMAVAATDVAVRAVAAPVKFESKTGKQFIII